MECLKVYIHLEDGKVLHTEISQSILNSYEKGTPLYYCYEGFVMMKEGLILSGSENTARKEFFWNLEKFLVDELSENPLISDSEYDAVPNDQPKLKIHPESIRVQRVVKITLIKENSSRAA